MQPEEKEFYSSIIILGGVIFAGLMVMLMLTLVALAVYNRVTERKVTKNLYDKKERENGQAKGGAQGRW